MPNNPFAVLVNRNNPLVQSEDDYKQNLLVDKLELFDMSLEDLTELSDNQLQIANTQMTSIPSMFIKKSGGVATTKLERTEERKVEERQRKQIVDEILAVTNKKTLGETAGYRVRLTYRLIRVLMTLTRGFDVMGCLTEMDLSDIHIPNSDNSKLLETPIVGLHNVKIILDSIYRSSETYTIDGEVYTGFTLMPPPIPDKFYVEELGGFETVRHLEEYELIEAISELRAEGLVPSSYDVIYDKNLLMYVDVIKNLIRYLGLDLGTKEDALSGYYGEQGLVEPKLIRMLFPSIEELISLEQDIMLDIQDKMMNHPSVSSLITTLHDLYGFSKIEALLLIKTSQRGIKDIYSLELDVERIKLAEELAVIASKSMEVGAVAKATSALRERAKILGLYEARQETDDNQELEDIVKKRVAELEGTTNNKD